MLFRNAESNAEVKGLDIDHLVLAISLVANKRFTLTVLSFRRWSTTSSCSEPLRCAVVPTALTAESTVSYSTNLPHHSYMLLTGCQISAYMSSPCHVEMILSEKKDVVAKPMDIVEKAKKESKKKQRRQLARGDY